LLVPFLYYVLVIVYRTKESALRRLYKYLFGLPILLGLIFALASLPFISPALSGCNVTPPRNVNFLEELSVDNCTASWGPYLGLFIIPGFAVLAYTTGAMARVYWCVRTIIKKANR
jgi:hypothetical protein